MYDRVELIYRPSTLVNLMDSEARGNVQIHSTGSNAVALNQAKLQLDALAALSTSTPMVPT